MEIIFILTLENVGAAARAIKTMGFQKIRLVNLCYHLSDPARWLAHTSNDILENAVVFNSFSDAIADCDFRIGTTAKQRSVKEDYLPLKEKNRKILVDLNFKEDSAILPRIIEHLNQLVESDIHLLHSICNKYIQKNS